MNIDKRLKDKLLSLTWQELLDGLRTEYRRRGSLVKILNEIDRERGGSGRIAETL